MKRCAPSGRLERPLFNSALVGTRRSTLGRPHIGNEVATLGKRIEQKVDVDEATVGSPDLGKRQDLVVIPVSVVD